MFRPLIHMLLVGILAFPPFASPQSPATARLAPGSSSGGGGRPKPSPGGGNRPGGSNRPGPGGNRPGSGGASPNPGAGNRPGPGGSNRPNPGSSRPNPGNCRPNPGGRPPSRPPNWGRPPQSRPSYHFRPGDRNLLRRHYLRHFASINRARRPSFLVGGFLPWGDIGYLTPVPISLYGSMPPIPPGYQAGYFDGYVVVYDPVTYFIADVLDLL